MEIFIQNLTINIGGATFVATVLVIGIMWFFNQKH